MKKITDFSNSLSILNTNKILDFDNLPKFIDKIASINKTINQFAIYQA